MLSDPKRRLADASEVTAEHFRVLYRKGTAGCLQRAGTATTSFYLSFTPRECPANPNCLFGLLPGPDAALPSARAEADALRREIGDDPRTLLRAADVPFAGLQNLGSTCFMGSLLQVLFANRALRIAVFEWGAESASAGESATRNEVMEQLRRLFAEMQLTARTHVSPESFLRSLNLPLGVQQDAAEFHKLLMQLIEDRVEKGRSASAKKLFHGLFEGKLAYSTTCCTCLAKSETSDRFSELKVPLETGGSSADKGLRELLLESLREEVLPDRECDKCHRKTEAKRKLSVATFPQQLVIELLRFTFDPASQSNKKVTRFVPIPEELDLASLCTDPRRAPPSHFTLAAVVCHIGQSANSGHYVSYVFDSDASCWWRFDDSIVRRCDKFPFASKPPSPAPPPPRDYYSETGFYNVDGFAHMDTSSATSACTTAGNETPYILFYHREDCPTLKVPHVPPSLASPLQKAAEELRASSEKYGELERTKTDEFRAYHQQLKEISKAAEVSPDEVEYNWISASWLRRFAQSPFNIPPIDNTPLLCPHGGVAFGKKKVLEMKRISRSVWNLLVGKYGGGPELTGQSECATCVQEWVKHRHAKEASMEEKKRLDYEMRPFSSYSYSSYSSEGTFWVAKSFVQKWSSSKMLPETLDNPTKPITCPHGKLCADDSLRTRVSDVFWRWLKKHYDSKDGPLVEFLGTALPCSECQRELQTHVMQQHELGNAKFDLRLSLMRPVELAYDLRENQKYFVVQAAWARQASEFVSYSPGPSPGTINTESLICEHGKLRVDVLQACFPASGHRRSLEFVTAEVWKLSVPLFGKKGPEISFLCLENKNSFHQNKPELVVGSFDPELCPECVEASRKAEEAERFTFTNRLVTVEKQSITGWGNERVELSVSSTTKIGELRLMIFQHFDIAPGCQKLECNGKILERDRLTLGEYKVPHSSTISLTRVGEGSFIIPDEDEVSAAPAARPNVAFEGTSFAGTSITGAQPSSSKPPALAPKIPAVSHTASHERTLAASAPPPASSAPKPREKACPRCTFLNSPAATRCDMCESPL